MHKQHKKRWAALVCVLLFLMAAAAGCSGQAAENSTAETGASSASGTGVSALAYENVKDEDLDDSWDKSGSTRIALEGGSITVDGGGATADGSTLTITEAGTYVLEGTLDDGQIVVEAPDEALVRIVLNGAELHCENSAAINCVTADKLVLILAEGTENTVSDGDSYIFPDTGTDEPSAAIFSKQDLTINGSGSLTVTANYNNGVGTKDDLILVSGNVQVTAANHAVRGRDSVIVIDAVLTLDAGNDGIQSNNDSAEDKGFIILYGGSYTITAVNDGIQAETALTVYGGDFDITAGGGSANAPERVEEEGPGGMNGGWADGGRTFPEDGTMPENMPDDLPEGMPEDGNMPEFMPEESNAETSTENMSVTEESGSEVSGEEDKAAGNDGVAEETAGSDETADDTASDSYKGLKAGGDLVVEGGSFTIDSADDALHGNANVSISGGTFTISTGDDAVHADTDLMVEGDVLMDITTCYEGLEGTNVTVNSGDITINATDDGINAAGGSSNGAEAGTGGRPDQFTGGGDHLLTVNGGTIRITAGYDGLDSNGDILITGGELYISAAGVEALGGDGAIDCDGSFTVTGGTLAGTGGTAIAIVGASVNAEGTQPVLNFQFTETQAAGTTVELKNEEGAVLISYTASKEFKTIALTSPEMLDGESYTVYTDGNEIYTVTLSGNLTSLSDTGETVDLSENGPGAGGMGGRGNRTQPGTSSEASDV